MDDVGSGAKVGVMRDLRLDLPLVPVKGEFERRILLERARSARDHRRWSGVTAHGVDGNSWAPGHREGNLRSVLGRDDFAAVIMAARLAHVVRELQLAAIRTFLELGRRQRVMAAAHVPLRRRGFSFWDSHCGTFECKSDNNKNCDDLRLISAG
jgi:hypothetical protein